MKPKSVLESAKNQGVWLTFDDVLVKPSHSGMVPKDVSIKTKLTARIPLHIPLVSADMDTVTGWKMAREIAKQGGIGFLWKHPSAEKQAEWVDKVKFTLNAKIDKPVTIGPDQTLEDVQRTLARYDNLFSSLVVVDSDNRVVGLVTNDRTQFANTGELVKDFMVTNPLTSDKEFNTKEAYDFMKHNKVAKLILVDFIGRLRGLYCFSDVKSLVEDINYLYNRDKRGQLRVGANVGVFIPGKNDAEFNDRVERLLKKNCDVLLVGTAHGDSENVINTVKHLKINFSSYDFDIVAGNVVTYEGAKTLFEAGADCVKVGIGPGSICTTRIVTGAGAPQITAVYEAARAANEVGKCIIADGGIRYSGDIVKALAAGASCVMLGGLLARTEEAPGEIVIHNGQRFKTYRGMGSLGAMRDADTGDRYAKSHDREKTVTEGVEGEVPLEGSVEDVVYKLIGGLRSGMGYAGVRSIEELNDTELIRVTKSGAREGYPHNVEVTEEDTSLKDS